MLVKDAHGDGEPHLYLYGELRSVEGPLLVGNVVEDDVRQRLVLRHELVHDGQAGRGQDKVEAHDQQGCHRLAKLLGVRLALGIRL